MTDEQPTDTPSRGKVILLSAAVAATVTAIAVVFVIPAEFGIDPTGLGEASGLTEIANPQACVTLERGLKRKGVLTPSDTALAPEPGQSDHWTYELQPYQEIELKYVLDKDAPIVFSWSAEGPLNYDMHAHPFEGGEALTESYAIAKGDQQHGRYVAAFSGIHGWHWQNRGLSTVRLTLVTSGRIAGSKVLDGPTEQNRELSPRPQ